LKGRVEKERKLLSTKTLCKRQLPNEPSSFTPTLDSSSRLPNVGETIRTDRRIVRSDDNSTDIEDVIIESGPEIESRTPKPANPLRNIPLKAKKSVPKSRRLDGVLKEHVDTEEIVNKILRSQSALTNREVLAACPKVAKRFFGRFIVTGEEPEIVKQMKAGDASRWFYTHGQKLLDLLQNLRGSPEARVRRIDQFLEDTRGERRKEGVSVQRVEHYDSD
jgi:hypothetical protein